MSLRRGDMIILSMGGVQVGALITNRINIVLDIIDASNKDSRAKLYKAGEHGWQITCESLYDPTGSITPGDVLGYLKAGTEIEMKYGEPYGDFWEGVALVASLDATGQKNNLSDFKFKLQGSELIEKGSVWISEEGKKVISEEGKTLILG